MDVEATCPKNATRGTWSICASYKPLIKCVAPGPAEPKTAPTFPVNFASAAAASAPTSS